MLRIVVRTILGLLLVFTTSIFAKTIQVNPDEDLQTILDQSQNGDQIVLMPGRYKGNLAINQSITLRSEKPRQALIIGDRKESTIVVNADDVIIKELTIEHSGLDLSEQDSGIFVNKKIKNTLIYKNLIRDNLIGIYLWGSIDSKVVENQIIGQKTGHVNDRGNGVQVWSSPGSIIKGNRIEFGRDGIFTTTSRENKFTDNYFENLRYAIHYMYTVHSRIQNNYSKNNTIAYALMFSDYLEVYDNISVGSKEHGVFANFINKSTIKNNIVLGPTEKCLMLYNSNFNQIGNNHFEGCRIGVHYTAGSQDNIVYGNNFIKNYNQVKFVGTSSYEFSKDGRGNYWSDQSGYDLNHDNINDQAYQPNSLSEQILWANSSTKVLFNSPVIQLLKWSQSYFPALMPGGVRDSFPRMQPYPHQLKDLTERKPPFDYQTGIAQ